MTHDHDQNQHDQKQHDENQHDENPHDRTCSDTNSGDPNSPNEACEPQSDRDQDGFDTGSSGPPTSPLPDRIAYRSASRPPRRLPKSRGDFALNPADLPGLPSHIFVTDKRGVPHIVPLRPELRKLHLHFLETALIYERFEPDLSRPLSLGRLSPPPLMPEEALNNPRRTITVYILGNTALKNLCQQLGAVAYKIGVTRRLDLGQRIIDLGRMQYGGWLAPPSSTSPGEGVLLPGAHEWFRHPIDGSHARGHLPEGMVVRDNAIDVVVPNEVTPEAFDKALGALLQDRDFNAFLASEAGRKRMAAAGFTPGHLLHSDYQLMSPVRRSRATELYLFRPRQEMGLLIQLVDHVRTQLIASGTVTAGATLDPRPDVAGL